MPLLIASLSSTGCRLRKQKGESCIDVVAVRIGRNYIITSDLPLIPSPTDNPDKPAPETMSTVAIMPPSRISTPPSVAVSPVKSPTKTSALPPVSIG